MQLLLLSNSTLPGQPFLGWPRPYIISFLGDRKRIAFVPYAAVTTSLDDYPSAVGSAFAEMGHDLFSLHAEKDPTKALESADAVAVGGGNTFQLLRSLYSTGLLKAIRDKVKGGMPYIGWSAGSNVACPTIMTSNDMPITEPPTFRAMGLVPFQINPHYTDARIAGHGGESRDQRIAEYLALHNNMTVAGLREGSLFHLSNGSLTVEGEALTVFRHGMEPLQIPGGTQLKADLSPLA